MRYLSFDLETELIARGYQSPIPVCAQWAWSDAPDAADLAPLFIGPDANAPVVGTLQGFLGTETIVGVNIAYDVACLLRWGFWSAADVFAAYDQGRILDLSVHERIAEIGAWTPRKKLSLDHLALVYGVEGVDKGSIEPDGTPTRLSYGRLLGAPLDAYSDTQIFYALGDATAGARIVERQRARFGDRVSWEDWASLSRLAFWLRLTSNNGLTTDPERVDELARLAREQLEALGSIAVEEGLIRLDGTKDMKAIRAAVTEAFDGCPPMTEEKRNRPPGSKPFVPNVRTDKNTLLESGDPLLEIFAEYGEWAAVENKDLAEGQDALLRAPIVHTKFGIADTTRTTSSKPNLQNLRRKAGIRECFRPSAPGNVFVACDHAGLELATLAQSIVTLLGRYEMASKLNAGEDLHAHIAAEIMGITYADAMALKAAHDKTFKNNRNCGKVVNFGRPGGMAAKTLVVYAKQSYGVRLTLDFAKDLIRHWNRVNPDGVAFLDYVHKLQRGERFEAVIPGTGILRRGMTYCSACNVHFQGPGAAIETRVGFEIARLIEVGGLPAKQVNFMHDEFMVECHRDDTDLVADAIKDTMITHARPLLPDVRIDAEVCAMVRWTKAADERRDPSGRLMIWGLDYE